MKFFKWIFRNYITIIALFLFVANCILFTLNLYEKEIFLGFIASIATLYLGIIKFKIETDQFSLELFKSFNDRYDDKLNDVFNRNRKKKEEEKLNHFTNEDRCIIIDYFNLCAEEYYWFKKNRIPQDVWAAWLFGINKNLSNPEIRKLFDEEIKEFGISYYGLEKVIDKPIQNG